jgi:uncharacterized protein DUF5615
MNVKQPCYLTDEDLRHSIVLATRRLEPSLQFPTVVEAGIAGRSDDQVLDFAFHNRLIVISHDVNTMSAAAERRLRRKEGMTGLFLVPQSRQNFAVAESLVLIWSASRAEEWYGRIVYLPI